MLLELREDWVLVAGSGICPLMHGGQLFAQILAEVGHQAPTVQLRPAFIGWRTLGAGLFAEHDDRREVWPQQLDQFSAIAGKRATDAERRAVSSMSEENVKNAFADIIGEPFVSKDWAARRLICSRTDLPGTASCSARRLHSRVRDSRERCTSPAWANAGIRLFVWLTSRPTSLLYSTMSPSLPTYTTCSRRSHACIADTGW